MRMEVFGRSLDHLAFMKETSLAFVRIPRAEARGASLSKGKSTDEENRFEILKEERFYRGTASNTLRIGEFLGTALAGAAIKADRHLIDFGIKLLAD